MKKLSVVVVFAILSVGCSNIETSYKATLCEGPLPYQGLALYAKSVELPDKDFVNGKAFDAPKTRKLDNAMLQAMGLTKAKVMSAAVATKKASWQATKSADGSPQTQKLYWASVGKAFTATVIFQLVEEGKISLDDTVAQWAPEAPNAANITIDNLLQHTAGLFSANEDLKVRKSARYYTPDEDIAISAQHGAMFCPGQHWRYSNTGYTVLGKIIEQVDGRAYHEAVNARISQRLNLATLRALAPQEKALDVALITPADGTESSLVTGWGYAAGSVVSSAEDMLRFWQALLTSELFAETNSEKMFEQLYPMFDKGTFYGRGVMLYSLPKSDSTSKQWLGHSGGMPGVKAIVVYSPEDKAFVAVALTGDGSVEATANLLLKQLKE